MLWLITTALRMRVLIVAAAIALMVFGVRGAEHLPLDVFPEFAPPVVEIQTEVPGITTEEVESLVSVPIENALNGVPYVKTIRSKSVLGLSSVRLIFQPGTDLLTARQLVQERLALVAPQLPQVAKAPVILPPLSSLSRAMKIGLTSKTLSQTDLTVLCRWTIRPRLMAVSGVANVAIWGDYDRQLQILVDPEKLAAHGLTMSGVMTAARRSATVGAGGFIDTGNQRLAVRHDSAISTPEELAATVVAFRNGAPLTLGDVAEVKFGSPPPIGDAIINDVPGIMLIVEKQPWANTLDVTRNVESAMQALSPALQGVEVDTTIFRPATFIERAIKNLTHSLLMGCGLVILVLIMFMFDWRAAFISATAIPLSLVASALVLAWRGETINTMVLAGLIIALGEVVDDAIIDVENILRRLRLNRELANPKSSFDVILAASLEVRSAVVYASLIVVLTLIPIVFLEGLAGSFFRPLAISYGLAIMVSLGVALTLTPALSMMLLPRSALKKRTSAPLANLIVRIYRGILPLTLRWPGLVVVGLLAFLSAGVVTGLSLGEELMPKFKETDFLMHWVEKPGIGIEAMDRITILASKELRAVPGVRNFGSHIGRAKAADEVVGPNFTELWISVDENAPYDETVAKVQAIVDGYPGLYRDLLTYLSERIKEVLTGASGSIVVRIFGPNLDELRNKAQEVGGVMKDVPGVTGLKVEPQVLVPQIAVRLRFDAISQFGLTPGDVIATCGSLLNGVKVGEIYEEQKIFDIVVWGVPSVRRDLDSLRRLMIDVPSGGQVPLGHLADVEIVPAPGSIQREGASRRIDVTCNAAGRDLGAVARDVEAAIRDKVKFQNGYHPEYLGEYAEAKASRQRILGLSLLSLLGILLLLYVDFESWRLAWLVFLTLPFALVGGVFGAYLGWGVLSLGSLVGFVTILGVAVRNAIMLIDHYRHLLVEEGATFDREFLIRGASERLTPIVMTSLTTALALIPILLSGELPGQEIEYPMALVILGGLTSSTLINLFALPAIYELVCRGRSPHSQSTT